jgi:hypothetical protein
MFLVAGEIPAEAPPFAFPFPDNIRQYVDTVLKARVDINREKAVTLTDAYAPLEAWSDAAVQAMRY